MGIPVSPEACTPSYLAEVHNSRCCDNSDTAANLLVSSQLGDCAGPGLQVLGYPLGQELAATLNVGNN